MKVMQFQGLGKKAIPISLPPVEHYDLTPSPDVPLAIMKRKLMATNDIYEAKKIAAEIKIHLEVSKKKKKNRTAHQVGLRHCFQFLKIATKITLQTGNL